MGGSNDEQTRKSQYCAPETRACGRADHRREFVRFATLIGMTAPAAYAFVGARYTPAAAQTASMPKGGTLRLGTRVKALNDPANIFMGRLLFQRHPSGLRIPDVD